MAGHGLPRLARLRIDGLVDFGNAGDDHRVGARIDDGVFGHAIGLCFANQTLAQMLKEKLGGLTTVGVTGSTPRDSQTSTGSCRACTACVRSIA